MSHLRSMSLLTAALLMPAFAVQAQMRQPPAGGAHPSGPPAAGQRGEGPRRGPPTRELAGLLGLTAQQSEALDVVLRERHEQMQAMRQREAGQREALVKASDDRVRKVLTPAQFGKFKQWEAERRPPPPRGMPPGGGQGGDGEGGPPPRG